MPTKKEPKRSESRKRPAKKTAAKPKRKTELPPTEAAVSELPDAGHLQTDYGPIEGERRPG